MRTLILLLFIATISHSQKIKTGWEVVSQEQCVVLSNSIDECDSIKHHDIKIARDLKNKKIHYDKDYFFESNVGTRKSYDILNYSKDDTTLTVVIKTNKKTLPLDIIKVVFKTDDSAFDIYYRNGTIYRCKG